MVIYHINLIIVKQSNIWLPIYYPKLNLILLLDTQDIQFSKASICDNFGHSYHVQVEIWRTAYFLLAYKKYDEVALLPHLRKKLIAVKVWHELILLYSDNIDSSLFTLVRYKNSMKITSWCSTFLNNSNSTDHLYIESS